MYIIEIISTLPTIINKLIIILSVLPVSKSTMSEVNPVVVIMEVASKKAISKFLFSIVVRYAAVMDIVAKNKIIINIADNVSFFLCGVNSDRDNFLNNLLHSFICNTLNTFIPPAVENPHPPTIINKIKITCAAPLKFGLFCECNPDVVLADIE